MNRLTAWILTLVLLAALLSGCTGSDSTESATPAPAEQTQATEETSAAPTEPSAESVEETGAPAVSLPLAEEEVTYEVWMTFNGNLTNWMSSLAENSVFQELEARTGVHMEFWEVAVPTQVEQFQITISSGEYPDVFSGIIGSYNGGPAQAVEDGVIYDLGPYLETLAPNYWGYINSDETIRKNTVTTEGYYYQFFMIMENSELVTGPVIRQDWLDELELDKPVTYEDYYEVLTAFKTEKGADAALMLPNMYGGMSNGYLSSGMGVMAAIETAPSLVMPFYQVEGEVKFGMLEPEYEEYLTMIAQWYQEGLIYQDFYTSTAPAWSPDENIILTGRSGVWFSQVDSIPTYEESAGDGMNLVAANDPVLSPGDSRHLADVGTDVEGNGNGWAITTTCENVELLIQYIDYCYSEEGSILCNYGVEGESFTYVDGEPVFTELISNNPDGMTPTYAICKYCWDQGPYIRNSARTYSLYDEELISFIDQWNENVDGAWNLPQGASISTENSDDYNSKITECSTFLTEQILMFITGARSLDEFGQFIEELKALGIEDCVQYWQEALDSYNSR